MGYFYVGVPLVILSEFIGFGFFCLFVWSESCLWFGCLQSLTSVCVGCYPHDGSWSICPPREVEQQAVPVAVPGHGALGRGHNPWRGGGCRACLIAWPLVAAATPSKVGATGDVWLQGPQQRW